MPDDSSVLGGFFGAVRQIVSERGGPAAGVVGRVAQAFVPRCHICQEQALLPVHCLLCKRPMCEKHGFFHILGVGLCTECIEESGIELDLAGQGFAPDGEGFPWSSLGIGPTQDVRAIKQAFRRKASEDHPDHHTEGTPEHAQAAERFKRLKMAYDEALSIAKGE